MDNLRPGRRVVAREELKDSKLPYVPVDTKGTICKVDRSMNDPNDSGLTVMLVDFDGYGERWVLEPLFKEVELIESAPIRAPRRKLTIKA
jgi:hypothetical protein